MGNRKLLSIVTPCYNEEGNISELYERISAVMSTLPYDYEHILIDNCSTDNTVAIIKEIAARDNRVKLIVNVRNFGIIRSGCHALFQVHGDACISMVSDLQDPPEMIPDFVKKWEEGFKAVLAVKPESEEPGIMFFIRKNYYNFLGLISDVQLVPNATGAGLIDREILDILKSINDPYPYVRGLICEIGFPIAKVVFRQPQRTRGITKNNFYSLYDIAMLGITSHSKVPLRLATMLGFAVSFMSLLVAFGYLAAKLAWWNTFSMGTAPLIIGLFFFSSVQLFFIGIIGEYIGSIHTKVQKKPLVIEKERVNF